MMGSDFSFPVLCLITLAISLESKGLLKKIENKDDRDFEVFLRKYKECGVNGDDYVSWGKIKDGISEGERWAKTVPLSGGVPEPTKSPCDRYYFTVNSQLWVHRNGKPRPIGAILPSMLSGLNSKSHKVPAESWIYLLESPLLDYDRMKRLEIDVVLLPEQPKDWGGLGYSAEWEAQDPIVMREFGWRKEKFLERIAKRILYAKTNFSTDFTDIDKIERPNCNWLTKSTKGCTEIIRVETKEHIETERVTGWVPKHEAKRFTMERFQSKGVLRWTVSKKKNTTFQEKWIEMKKEAERGPMNDLLNLRKEVIEKNAIGLIFVNDFKLYDDQRFSVILKGINDPFLFKEKNPTRLISGRSVKEKIAFLRDWEEKNVRKKDSIEIQESSAKIETYRDKSGRRRWKVDGVGSMDSEEMKLERRNRKVSSDFLEGDELITEF